MARSRSTVIGADIAASHLHAMAMNMLTFREAFEDIGEDFRFQAESQFNLRGTLPGIRGPWAALSPRTVFLRGGGNTPLKRFNNLMSSYANKNARGNISTSNLMTAKFGSRYKGRANNKKIVPIAKFHQEGTRVMSARPVVLANKQLDLEILEAFSDHIFDGWA